MKFLLFWFLLVFVSRFLIKILMAFEDIKVINYNDDYSSHSENINAGISFLLEHRDE